MAIEFNAASCLGTSYFMPHYTRTKMPWSTLPQRRIQSERNLRNLS